MFASANNFAFVFWIAVIPAFLSFLLIAFLVREPERPADFQPVKSPLSRAELARLGGSFWRVAAVAALFTLARFSEAFLILRAQSAGLSIALVPGVLVLMNAVFTLSAYPAGVLSDRMDRGAILSAGLLVLIAADLVLAFSAGLTGIGIGVALWGLHMGLTQGLLSTLVADAAPAGLRGTAFGVFNLVSGLALLAASVIAGSLWDAAGPKGTFLAGAAFATLSLGGLFVLRTSAGARPRKASQQGIPDKL